MKAIRAGFQMDVVNLPLDRLLPSRKLKPGVKETARYKVIESSVRQVGLVELLVVYPSGKDGRYVVLDGHLRLEVLKELGWAEATCLVSTDDENCTYNHRVSRIAPIQETRMIQKAIASGVPEDRIASTLNVTIETIRHSKSRLTGISADAIEILKDKPIAEGALRMFKKVAPYRQVEMADMMRSANTYSASYAKVLYAATPSDQLLEPTKPESNSGQLSKLHVEMHVVERDFANLEETYSRDMLNLQLARAYLKTLLQNARVSKYLSQKHGDLRSELEKVVEVAAL